MARFFVSRKNVQDKRATIVGEELDHLRRVLRLGPGDHVTLFDDAGWEHETVIRFTGPDHGDLEILRSYQTQRESPLYLTLALGLTKGGKMDFVVEKATELGVQAIAPFFSTYTVPKLDQEKIAKRTARWQKIALSATKQCGRTRVPEVSALCDFRELLSGPWTGALKLLCWEGEALQTLNQARAAAGDVRSVLLVIGPEGGFSGEEAKLAQQHGFWSVQLGRRILRAETAAVTAISLVQFLWGDLG